MKFFAVLTSIVTLMVGVVAPATAQDTTTVYAEVDSRYVLQDLGAEASPDPSLQGGVTKTWGKLAVDVWTGTGLSGKGQYGERGFQDEIDVKVDYNETAETPFGRLTIQTSAAIYLLSSFKRLDDDMLQFYVDVGYPMDFGWITVTPFVRPTQWVGLGTIEDESLLRAGARITVPLTDGWSIDADPSLNKLFTSEKEHYRTKVSFSKDLGDGAVFQINVKVTDGAPTTFGIGASKTF